MKTSWIAIGLVALALLIAGISRLSGDERTLRKTLRHLVRDLEKEGPEKLWTAERRADRIARRFTLEPDVRLASSGLSFEGRNDLRAMVFRIRSGIERIRVRTEDVDVRVEPGRKRATLTGTAMAKLTIAGETEEMFQEFEIEWTRGKDGWLIEGVRTRDAMRHPDR